MRSIRSLTLLELMISLALLSIVVLGATRLNLFGHGTALFAERKAAIQNDLTIVFEYMHKYFQRAIGNGSNYPVWITPLQVSGPPTNPGAVFTGNLSWLRYVRVRQDSNANGKADPGDSRFSFLWQLNNGGAVFMYDVSFRDPAANNQSGTLLSSRITRFNLCYCGPADPWGYFNPYSADPALHPGCLQCDNREINPYVEVEATSCWNPESDINAGNPASGTTCGRPDNPQVTMRQRMYMPQVTGQNP